MFNGLLSFGSGLHEGRPLRSWPRRGKPIGITIHESVTRKLEPEDVLAGRGLGVHDVIQREEGARPPRTTHHAPYDHSVAHAGRWHNRHDIALEIESEYRPAAGDEAARLVVGAQSSTGIADVIRGDWVWKPRKAKHRLYRCPSLMQLEVSWHRVKTIASVHRIPLRFSGVDETHGFRWGRVAGHKAPGIRAHANWKHADGLFPTCYMAIRELGYTPAVAYRHTIDLATMPMRRHRDRWTLLPKRVNA